MRERGWLVARELTRLAGSAVALALLLLVALLVAGAVVGPEQTQQGAEIDLSEAPAEIVADGVRELTWQNHERTTTLTGEGPNETQRTRTVWTVDHRRRSMRLVQYPYLSSPNGTPEFDGPRSDRFVTAGHVWYRQGGRWVRFSTDRSMVSYTAGTNPISPPDGLEAVPFEVTKRNGTTVVLSAEDTASLRGSSGLALHGSNTTATAVIDLQGDPALRRLTFRNTTGNATLTVTYRIRDVGEARVERPEPMPPVTTTELLYRAALGAARIWGWLGLP